MSQESTGLVWLDLWNGRASCLVVFVGFNMGFTQRIRTSRWDGSCSYRSKPLQKGAGAFSEQFLSTEIPQFTHSSVRSGKRDKKVGCGSVAGGGV